MSKEANLNRLPVQCKNVSRSEEVLNINGSIYDMPKR